MSEDTEAPKKGRSNAILTYETVEDIKLGIQEVALKLDHLRQDVGGMDNNYRDHEVRLRVLEAAENARTGGSGMAAFLYGSVWPAATVIIAAISIYMSK